MKLTEAVARAATPEELVSVLEEVGRRYLLARTEEQKFSDAKHEIREACLAALRRLEVTSHDWDVDDKRFRAQTYDVTKVMPSRDLIRKLDALGLSHCYTTEYRLNEMALWAEVRREKIGIEEIRQLSEIRTTEAFRISEVKSREEREVEVAD